MTTQKTYKSRYHDLHDACCRFLEQTHWEYPKYDGRHKKIFINGDQKYEEVLRTQKAIDDLWDEYRREFKWQLLWKGIYYKIPYLWRVNINKLIRLRKPMKYYLPYWILRRWRNG